MATDPFSQDDRPLAVDTPLKKDLLLLETVSGTEELSRLFQFELSMLAPADEDVAFDQLLGQPVCVTVRDDDAPGRYIHGIVAGLAQGERVEGASGKTVFTRYYADVVPKVWLLTKVVRNRIFQQKTVPDILAEVFKGYDVSKKTQGTYEPRDYCVQYRESDLNFACRLMEDEGIFFYFDHTSKAHTLVYGDTPTGHTAVSPAKVPFFAEGTSDAGETVMTWTKRQRVRSGKVTLWDYSFESSRAEENYEAVETVAGKASVGTVSHAKTAGGADKLEQFLTQAGFAPRFDGISPGGGEDAAQLAKINPDGRRTAKLRLKEETWPGLVVDGMSDIRRLTAGRTFELDGHPHANGKYLAVKLDLAASIEGAYTSGGSRPLSFRNQFTAIPSATPFGPVRSTPKPRAEGLQTAIVVGPDGDDIFTDKYGRIKVHFHWDRDNKPKSEASSCWVRVATSWAGQQWGAIHIPRVGHEVLIGFEDGDPDQPICVGSLYNAVNMPPYVLPDNKTKSGIMSRSTTKGDAKTFNELRFEDKKDAEQIYFHAERDFLREVENNDALKVGFETKKDGNRVVEVFNNEDIVIGGGKTDAKDGSQKLSVFNSQTVTIGSGEGQAKDGSLNLTVYKDRVAVVKTGDDKLTVDKGGQFVTISTGDNKTAIKAGGRTTEIMKDDVLTIKSGNQKTAVSAGASKLEAMQSIEFKCGTSSLKLSPAGIQMKGLKVDIQGEIMVSMKATIVKVDASGFLILKGGITMIN